jgi:hypothetical protein
MAGADEFTATGRASAAAFNIAIPSPPESGYTSEGDGPR